MASMALDGDVRKTLLDRTDAEKVFRPWWDTIEDMLLNTLIGLGKTHMLHLRKNISYKNCYFFAINNASNNIQSPYFISESMS